MSVLTAFLSLALEAKLGYPDRLFAAIGHPVTWIGRLISCLDRALNRATDSDRTRRLYGVAALVAIVGVPAIIAYVVEGMLLAHPLGFFVVVLLGTTLLAQKSLAEHVEAVAKALETGGLAAGREAVSRIVGRDPETLDRALRSGHSGQPRRSRTSVERQSVKALHPGGRRDWLERRNDRAR